MILRKLRTAMAGGLGILLFPLVAAQAHSSHQKTFNLRLLSFQADFIFKGRVVAVRYRDSEPGNRTDETGAPVLDEDGQPARRDGSGLPHTFVTFEIEKIYKGKAAAKTVTLRFYGGVSSEPWVGADDSGTTVSVPQTFEV